MTKQEFFSQKRLEVENVTPNDIYTIYKQAETGQVICELNVRSKKGGERVEIAVLADMHVHVINDEDKEDEEVMYTYRCRGMTFRHDVIFTAQKRAVQAAQYADLTVIAGDMIDYASKGALEYAKKEIIEKLPSLLLTMGNHDITRNVCTEREDKLSYEEREDLLRQYWTNDLHYATKTLQDKVVCVAVDNTSKAFYTDEVIEKFEKEIERARKDNNIILLFQHEPISTGDPRDREARSILPHRKEFWNICDHHKCGPEDTNENNIKMLDLIKDNADVIYGIFCGHHHDAIYTEITGSYINQSGERVERIIPQHAVSGCPYSNCAGVVTIIKVD